VEGQAIVLVPPLCQLYEQSTPTAPNILETTNQTYLAKEVFSSLFFFGESLKGWNVKGEESKTQIVHFFKLFSENKFTIVKMQPKTVLTPVID
jgi:hypothetical protein